MTIQHVRGLIRQLRTTRSLALADEIERSLERPPTDRLETDASGPRRVSVVSDGNYVMDGGGLFGDMPRVIWERWAKPDRKHRVRLGLNCLLIQSDTETVLVDAGLGHLDPVVCREIYGHSSSRLVANLKKEGVRARQVTTVILTHLHLAHAGGLARLTKDGDLAPTFPKARHVVQRAAWQERRSARPQFGPMSGYLDMLEERGLLHLIDGDCLVMPGVRTVLTQGHGPGHQAVLVDGRERVAYLADLVPTRWHLWEMVRNGHDLDPTRGLRERQDLLRLLEGWLIVFAHGYEERGGYLTRKYGHLEFEALNL